MKHLFQVLFFTGVVPLVLSVTRKYYLIQQGKSWSDAQAYCQAKYVDLAVIESNDDMVRLQNEAQRQQFSSGAWIGLYNDINSWHWSMGNEPLGSMGPWCSNQPDNWKGIEFCIAFTLSGWNDMPCTLTLPSVCFDGTKTGNQRYIYISNRVTWPAAQSYCRQHYTDLASDRDATEHSVIMGKVSGDTWIGLVRDTWKWTDQTNFSTISWMPGKPDNVLWDENCGYLDNSQAVDAQCSDIMPFFCYAIIKEKQQIMKVKVRSNQDVNDPTVKATILEQIKQKLKDHGMTESITVKWREQADGKVFHKEKEYNTIVKKVEL